MHFPKLFSLSLCSFAMIALAASRGSAQQWSVPLYNIHLEDPAGIHDRVNAESVEFMPDGKTLVTAGFFYHAAKKKSVGEVCLRKVADGTLIATLRGTAKLYSLRAGSLAVASTGKFIAAAGLTEERTWVVDIFDAATKKVVHTLIGDRSPATCLAFSPDAKVLAVAHMKGTIELWGLHDGKLISSFAADKDEVWPVAFSPMGQFLATGNHDGSISFWNAKNCKKIGQIPPQPDLLDVAAVAFSPDGKLVACGGLPKGEGVSPVYVWQIAQSGKDNGNVITTPQARFEGHRAYMYSLVFSPNSETLASANQDATVKLWDLRMKK